MNIEHLLVLIFKYNILLIEIFFAMSLIGMFILAFRFFVSKDEAVGSAPDWNRLEENIKRILENASSVPAKPAPVVTLSTTSDRPEGMSETVFIHELQTQLERSQLQLMQKEEELKKLNEALVVAESLPKVAETKEGASSGGAETAVFEEKIKDLESRLNEYSIIEDDIADLSFYKEETVRLQSEVDKLTAELAARSEAESSNPLVAISPATNITTVVSAESDVSDNDNDNDNVPIEPIEVVKPKPIESPSLGSIAPVANVSDTADAAFIDNDIMAEFERAVAEQKAVSAAAKTAKAEIKAEKIAETLRSENEAKSVETEDSSFNPVKNVGSSASDDSGVGDKMPEGDINIDKMLTEAQDLTSLDETQESINAIDSTLDTDKLLKEATGMGNIDSEALSEFSDFVKKEGA